MTSFTPAQITVIQALATGATVTAAAQLASISRPTVYTWLGDPAIQSALAFARHEHAVTVRDKLQALTTLALETLEAILKNPKSSPSVLLRATLAILTRKNWNLPAPSVEECEPIQQAFAGMTQAASPGPDFTELYTSPNFEPHAPDPTLTVTTPIPQTP
jgi:hypothetical protein